MTFILDNNVTFVHYNLRTGKSVIRNFSRIVLSNLRCSLTALTPMCDTLLSA